MPFIEIIGDPCNQQGIVAQQKVPPVPIKLNKANVKAIIGDKVILQEGKFLRANGSNFTNLRIAEHKVFA